MAASPYATSTVGRARRSLPYLAAGVSCALLLSACGTRISDERVAQASKGGPAEVTVGADVNNGGLPGDASAPGNTGTVATGAGLPVATAAPGTTNAPATGSNPANPTGGSKNNGGAAGTNGAGTAGGAAPAAGGTACKAQGPPIVLGSVVEYSGIIGANVGSAIPVMGAWAKWINANGGIACHPVVVYSQDSASDPGKASSQVQDLVKNRKAIGLVANFVPLSISGFKSAVDSLKVPVVGGDLFSTTWWSDPLFYPVGTHVDANAAGSTISAASGGANKVAVIYCIEAAVCPPYKDAIKKNAAANGYSVVYDVQVSITAPDYTTQCQSAKNAGATQISMIVEGSGVSRIARSCANIGYFPKFAVASLGATFDQNDENVKKMTPTIASAANDWFTAGSAGQKEFQEAIKRYAPTLTLNATAPLAWADGMMVKAAIEKLGPSAVGVPITTDMLRKGLSMIKNETLKDMIRPTSFSPTQGVNPPTPCYYSMIFSSASSPGKWAKGPNGCLKGLAGASSISSSLASSRSGGLEQASLGLWALAGTWVLARRGSRPA
jgi:branched-chain amino acid transport system substrate-binding protein